MRTDTRGGRYAAEKRRCGEASPAGRPCAGAQGALKRVDLQPDEFLADLVEQAIEGDVDFGVGVVGSVGQLRTDVIDAILTDLWQFIDA